MDSSYVLIGELDQVEVYQRREGRSVELSAVGEIAASPELVHAMLLAHTDPRVIASLAEGWVARACPDVHAFSLQARWTKGGAPNLSFNLVDNRGVITRARNWVTQIKGSWGFDAVEDGAWTRAILHVGIDYAGPVSRWAIRECAMHDLPTLFQVLRALAGDRRPARRPAANLGR